MIKKLLILCLTLALVISFLPAAGFEAYAAGSTITAPSSLPYSDEEWEILMLVNKERNAESLDPLTGFDLMQEVGDIRANELTEYYSHNRPDGTDCFTVIDELNIPWRALGENIAYGYQSPTEVMTGWMNSEGHRANILNENYTHIGIGLQIGTDAIPYWIQMFLGISSYTSFQLVTPDNTVFEKGTSIEEMGIYAVLNSSTYGTCYLPIISEYCSGVDVDTSGKQQLSVSVLGYSANVDITIAGDDCAAKIGDTAYATLAAAMADAKSGDTVSLQADAEATLINVLDGVTLDLNGHTLTAQYVFSVKTANIVDSTDNGMLIVDPNNFAISATNAMLPVKNGSGYIFDDASIVDNRSGMGLTLDEETDKFTFKFVTFFGSALTDPVNALLYDDGSENNDLSVVVRLEWNTENGTAYQSFVYNNEQVKDVVAADGSKAFKLTVNNYKDISNLTLKAMILTDEGVEIAGTEYTVTE